MRCGAVVVLLLGALLPIGGCADGSFRAPGAGRSEDLVQRAAQTWAVTQLGAGAARGSLIEARGELHRNDFGVGPSFTWALTFRSDRPVAPEELARTLGQACAFRFARVQRDTRITAALAGRGTDTLVPTVLGIGCDDRIDRVARRLRHLDAHPYPHDVLETHISVVGDHFEVSALASVRPPGDASTVVDRASHYFCAYPGAGGDIVHLRLLEKGASTSVPEIYCRLLA